ncbi:MAG: hypothetical protein OXJ90_25850 [Spirochaetaceae bacterium]|nr:hypothetical protein [Spirochaetaceae bacterium]
MRYARRGTGLLFAGLLLAATIAGAAPTAEEGASGPMEIEWIGSWTYSVPEDALVVTMIEERFGVDLKLKQVDLNDADERNLLVSTGELPDVGEFIRGQDPLKMYQDGLMRSIPKQMIRDHAPNMTEHYDKYPAIWLMANAPEDAESVYVLAAYKGNGQGVSDLPKIRIDWIENVGIPFDESLLIDYTPSGKDPQFDGRYQFYDEQITIDDLETIMYAFRDGDPDGNGKNDTVAHAVTAAHRGIRPISGAFGVDGWVYWWTYFDDGETRLGVTSDRWKEGLRTLSKWYADKLIPQQLPDFGYNDAWALIGEGRSGIWTDGIGFGNETRPPMNILMRDPEANVAVVPGFTGPDGFAGAPWDYPLWVVSGGYGVRADVSDEKLAKILEIADWTNWTREGFILIHYGVEGQHFEWAGEPYYSFAGRIGSQRPPHPDGIYAFRYNVPDWFPEIAGDPQQTAVNAELTAGKWSWVSNRPYRYDVFVETDFQEVRQQYGTAMGTLHSEFMWRIITGQGDLDAEWEGHVERFMDAGGSALLAELKKAPIVPELEMGNKVIGP